jgi:hypothetical protein
MKYDSGKLGITKYDSEYPVPWEWRRKKRNCSNNQLGIKKLRHHQVKEIKKRMMNAEPGELDQVIDHIAKEYDRSREAILAIKRGEIFKGVKV